MFEKATSVESMMNSEWSVVDDIGHKLGFQDDHSHGARGVTERFNGYGHFVSHLLWS